MSNRYGIAEWYGFDFTNLSPKEIREFAIKPPFDCPFRYPAGKCNKAGGVCSMRLYTDSEGRIMPLDNSIVTMCPNRFLQNGQIFNDVSEKILSKINPIVTTEIPFLMSEDQDNDKKFVGMIDMVIVDDESKNLNWCAMEIQAVYFSGKSMSREIKQYKTWNKDEIPFPVENRRPDFRSSGPKRLMPQLQIKVPTISRWGKKMAVVIDRSFWNSMAKMDKVKHLSNCDIVWFIMNYRSIKNKLDIYVEEVFLTTLNDAVIGLTGGIPTSIGDFENNLKAKMQKSGFRVQPG